MIQNHQFESEVLKKMGSETAFLDLFFMSPLCRHLHNLLLSAQNWLFLLQFDTELFIWANCLRLCGIDLFGCDPDHR